MEQHSQPAKSSTDWLRSEYVRRRQKNPAYTMRSFARHLEISSGRMSEILAKKRNLTYAMADKVADRLGYAPPERHAFLELVSTESSSRKSSRTIKHSEYTNLSAEMFSVIADWQHFAILNLIKLKSFRNEPRWIASRLNISVTEVHSALERLQMLGMIEKVPNSGLKRTISTFVTSYEVPSAALRRSHKQDLERAIAALEDVPLPLRNITSITFPADLKKIKKAKVLIKDFERRIAKLMNSSKATAVYNLNVQLIPVTKEELS